MKTRMYLSDVIKHYVFVVFLSKGKHYYESCVMPTVKHVEINCVGLLLIRGSGLTQNSDGKWNQNINCMC